MIASHQPTIFKVLPVVAAASSLKNGLMSFGVQPNAEIIEKVGQNRHRWLAEVGISISQTTLVRVTYGPEIDYVRMQDIDETSAGRGMLSPNDGLIADAMFTKTAGHGLFLPLADCGGVVLYDAAHQALGVVHLGRQATFAGLARRAVLHMQKKYGTNPADLFIWISPSISGDSYWLHSFAHADDQRWQAFSKPKNNGWLVDLQGFNEAEFRALGVQANHIEHANIDTASHADYPSHYRYQTHGETAKAGRFAIVAWLK